MAAAAVTSFFYPDLHSACPRFPWTSFNKEILNVTIAAAFLSRRAPFTRQEWCLVLAELGQCLVKGIHPPLYLLKAAGVCNPDEPLSVLAKGVPWNDSHLRFAKKA
jgi:hypothetical protein